MRSEVGIVWWRDKRRDASWVVVVMVVVSKSRQEVGEIQLVHHL